MKYIEVTFHLDDTGFYRDMLVDTLGNEGPYESFVETTDGLKAYIAADQYDEAYLQATSQAFPVPLRFKAEVMEDRDWNAEWEKNHAAVLVRYEGGSLWVRAPFHPHRGDVDYEIIIEPKMSFGTAHHPTTYMMLSYLAELPVMGKRVLDMGCGTAVLAIMAKMRGAETVAGIDIDEWAYNNAKENVATNHVDVNLALGDAKQIEGQYDMIVANINRNILLTDMQHYAAAMPQSGATMVISGFYAADEEALIAQAGSLGFALRSKKEREGWSALELAR